MASLEFGPGCLKEEEFIALRDGSFQLHCPKMRLEQCDRKRPRTYSGPGIIRQASDTRLQFSLYAEAAPALKESLFSLRDIPAGQAIPEDRFFVLTATDLRQRKWSSSRLLPDWTISAQEAAVCNGVIKELTSREELSEPFKRDHLFLRLFDRTSLPYNVREKTTTVIGDKELTSSSLSVLQFSAAGFDLCLRDHLGATLVEVTSRDSEFPSGVETRILEALQFVLARPVSWSVFTKYGRKQRVVSVREPFSEDLEPRIQPPVSLKLGEHESFSAMFGRYLEHVISCRSDRMHPISRHMRAICRASTSSLNAEALVSCTAIESLLKETNEAAPNFTDEEQEWIEKAKKFIKSWDGPTKLGNRLLGLFGILNQPSANKALRSLGSDGVIAARQAKAWKKLRNKVAHGDPLTDTSVEELVSLCDAVLVLFYHLVFHRTGYEGKYVDYSRVGWPTQQYGTRGEE